MDVEVISHLDFRQFSADCKLVVVLAEGARDIVDMIVRRRLFAEYGNVVVGAVHGRTHQIDRTGIHADVIFVNVFLMNGLGDKRAVGSQHEAAHLRINRDLTESRGNQDFLVNPLHLSADLRNIVGALFRAIGDAHASREVDEGNLRARLLF